MLSKQPKEGKHIHFYAHTDNARYLETLPNKNAAINEALRLYAEATQSAQPIVSTLRSYAMAAGVNTTPSHRMVCPNGHLWLNGSKRCVNKKCEYGL